MKYLNLLTIIFSAVLFISCNGTEKKASEKVVSDFYNALRKTDSLEIKKFYPNFEKLGAYLKSSRIEILDVVKTQNDVYEVKIHNFFTNVKKVKFDQMISFFCKANPNNKEQFIIEDSKGLNNFEETNEYKFAVNTGFIKKNNELSDQKIAQKILESQKLLAVLYKEKMESLRKELVIENWGWEFGFVNTYANGHGKIVNHSTHDFSTLKFKLTFVDNLGGITKIDDGYLVYAKLAKGESADFTTISSEIGNAVKAYIQIEFDTYEILEMLYEAKYKGNEFRLL